MSDELETLERPQTKAVERQEESGPVNESEETFEMNAEYIAEQAREAMRVFFLPITSIVRAARSKRRAVRREAQGDRKVA